MTWVRDLSEHGRLRLTGPDRKRFLQGMVTNDVAALEVGRGALSAMLTVKGKLLGDLVVYVDTDSIFIECEAIVRTKLYDILQKHILMDEVEIVDVTDSGREIGVYGDGAARAISEALKSPLPTLAPYAHVIINEVRVAATPELGIPGFHLFGEISVAGEAMSDAEYEIRRVEAGQPKYGVDMDEDRLLLECLPDAVSFTKGCYMGQEPIARAHSRGQINRKLCGLKLDGDSPAVAGAKLSAPTREDAGFITSSVVSPRTGAIALGYVHRTVWESGTTLTVHDSSGPRSAKVVPLPFITASQS